MCVCICINDRSLSMRCSHFYLCYARQPQDFYMLLLGETGSGKSTLLNMLVNFYRGKAESRKILPAPKDLKLAVPTKFLSATEPEGRFHSEKDVTQRECFGGKYAS